jgi:hypothetical protein
LVYATERLTNFSEKMCSVAAVCDEMIGNTSLLCIVHAESFHMGAAIQCGVIADDIRRAVIQDGSFFSMPCSELVLSL